MSRYSIYGTFYSIIENFDAVWIGNSGVGQDKNINCRSCASTGECTKNPNYLLPNCSVSCQR